MDYIFSNLFGKNQKADDFSAVEAMNEEIRRVGGPLHFSVHRDHDGWRAQCNEIDGIITGGLNSDPSNEEIEKNIREAIYTAFNVSLVPNKEEKVVKNIDDLQAVYRFENNQKVAA